MSACGYRLIFTHCRAFPSSRHKSRGRLLTLHGDHCLIRRSIKVGADTRLVHSVELGDIEDRFYILYFVPLLEVVLSVDRVFGSASIVLFGMICERGVALIMRYTLLEALFVDHGVGSGVPRTVTGTLIEDRVRLTHLFGLMEFHFGSSFYFAVCSVHFESSDHFQIVTTVIQSCRIVCLTHIVWFFNTGFLINCLRLVSHILILDILLGAIIGGN